MNATTNEARFAGIGAVDEQQSVSDATRAAQYGILNEAAGAIFGLITVVYIVSSLFALVH
jgi:hypothetical protein